MRPQWLEDLAGLEDGPEAIAEIETLADWWDGKAIEDDDELWMALAVMAGLALSVWRARPDGPLSGELGIHSVRCDWPDGRRMALVVLSDPPGDGTPETMEQARALLGTHRQEVAVLRAEVEALKVALAEARGEDLEPYCYGVTT